MTALTGETGAGKTLLVEALELLRRRAGRPGARAARGRARPWSRAGSPSTTTRRSSWPGPCPPRVGRGPGSTVGWRPVSALAEAGARLLELHGQHAQQSLLDGPGPAPRPRRLRRHRPRTALTAARARRRALHAELDALGGDDRARARQADLLRYQLDEIDGAATRRPRRGRRAGRRGGTTGRGRRPSRRGRRRPRPPSTAVSGRGPSTSSISLGRAHGPPWRAEARCRAWRSAWHRSRPTPPTWPPTSAMWSRPGRTTPSASQEVQARRQLLRELSRKYGEGVAGVLAYARGRAGLRRRARRRPRSGRAELVAELEGGRSGGGRRRGRRRQRPGARRRRAGPGRARRACRAWPCPAPASR